MKTLVGNKECSPIDTRARQRSLVAFIIFSVVISMLSCIAAIPVAINYFKDENHSTAKAEMPVPAEKIYRTALNMAEEKDLQILKKEDDKLYLEVTDGVQTASLKAEPAGNDKTEITVTATLPSKEGQEKEQRKEEQKELTLRVINRLCERLEVKCTITNTKQ